MWNVRFLAEHATTLRALRLAANRLSADGARTVLRAAAASALRLEELDLSRSKVKCCLRVCAHTAPRRVTSHHTTPQLEGLDLPRSKVRRQARQGIADHREPTKRRRGEAANESHGATARQPRHGETKHTHTHTHARPTKHHRVAPRERKRGGDDGGDGGGGDDDDEDDAIRLVDERNGSSPSSVVVS